MYIAKKKKNFSDYLFFITSLNILFPSFITHPLIHQAWLQIHFDSLPNPNIPSKDEKSLIILLNVQRPRKRPDKATLTIRPGC